MTLDEMFQKVTQRHSLPWVWEYGVSERTTWGLVDARGNYILRFAGSNDISLCPEPEDAMNAILHAVSTYDERESKIIELQDQVTSKHNAMKMAAANADAYRLQLAARDEVLREVGGSIERLINVSAAMSRVPYGSVAATAKAEAAYNAAFDALTPLLVKIQSVLAVKP